MTSKLLFFFSFIFVFIACESGQKNEIVREVTTTKKLEKSETHTFKSYWYSGKAEISSYALKQFRYGEVRDGEVVLVFVTEPFSLSKQVKLDDPKAAKTDNVSVMKLNHIRKFNTGIYDYSIMTSTFTPINTENYPLTLKSTTSIQEWCGQTFTQLNLEGSDYIFKQFSYFESEGDEEGKIPAARLEEDLMTRIRIQNGELAEGEIDLIPSTIYNRFSHQKMQVAKAEISKSQSEDRIQYTVKYLSLDRILTIDVEHKFPYKIMGWTEDNGDGTPTIARLKASVHEPYWKQKRLADEAKRDTLKLIK